MNIKWIIATIISFISAIGILLYGIGAYKQAKAYEDSIQNKPQEISDNIEKNRRKLYYEDDMVDKIIVDRKNKDLLFEIMTATINEYNVGEYFKNSNAERTLRLLEKEIDRYFLNRKENEDIYLLIWAKGYADGTPVNSNGFYSGNCIYDVEYYFEDDKYFQNKQTVNFINGHTRMENHYYAVLRAYYIVQHLKVMYPNTDNSQIKIIAKEYKEKGPQYRGCDLQIVVKNALMKEYDELGLGAKKFIEWGWVK